MIYPYYKFVFAFLGYSLITFSADLFEGLIDLDPLDSNQSSKVIKSSAKNSVVTFICAIYRKQQVLTRTQLARVQEMLEKGSPIEERDIHSNLTSVMLAAQHKDSNLVELLLNYGADARACNGIKTVAEYAAPDINLIIALSRAAKSLPILLSFVYAANRDLSKHERAIVQFLLKNGARVNERDINRNLTSLMLAAERGDIETINLLLAFHADKTLLGEGKTAADFARSKKSKTLLRP